MYNYENERAIMKKTLVKHGNSLAVVVDKAICDLLELEVGSEFDMQLKDDSLVFHLIKEAPEECSEEN